MTVDPSTLRNLKRRKPVPLADAAARYRKQRGVYLLYRIGGRPLYGGASGHPALHPSEDLPIYIGKAADLGKRLSRHRGVILKVNLNVDEFAVRVVETGETNPDQIEDELINIFRPYWNVGLTGFGGNAPGRFRHSKPSAWDRMHLGRGSNDSVITMTLQERDEELRGAELAAEERLLARFKRAIKKRERDSLDSGGSLKADSLWALYSELEGSLSPA